LLKAVDQFDISVRDVGKAAKATGKKPSGPSGTAGGKKYDPKVARSSKPAASEPSPGAPDDDWFLEDEPELGAAGPGEKPAKGKGKKKAQPEPEVDDDGFPDLPAPQPASFEVGGDDDEEGYRSPFGALGFGGWSSWDDVPDWMRDPEKMPGPPGGRT